MRRIIFTGIIVVFLVSTVLAVSDPFDAVFSQFKTSFQKKDYLKALQSLRYSIELFWNQSHLFVNNVRFVRGENNSYGMYEPKDGDKFKPGEDIYLYMEPVAYVLKKTPKGYYDFGFVIDCFVEDKDGKILIGQRDFAKLNLTSWNFSTEVALTLTYTFTGLKPGRYKIVTILNDKHSDKKATIEKWFNII